MIITCQHSFKYFCIEGGSEQGVAEVDEDLMLVNGVESLTMGTVSKEIMIKAAIEAENLREISKDASKEKMDMVDGTQNVERMDATGGQAAERCKKRKDSKNLKSSSTKHNMTTRKSKAQEVQVQKEMGTAEDEVSKIMETGTAIGFDFRGVSEEVVEAIKRRELEDEARYRVLSG